MRIVLIYLNNCKYVHRGVGEIYSVLKTTPHEIHFYDSAYSDLRTINYSMFDVVMLSVSTVHYNDAVPLARYIKETSNAKILMGGIHSTIMKTKILEDCKEIDYLCIGEGEDFVVDFVNHFNTPKLLDILNLAYRDKDGIRANVVRECTNLHSLPVFNYAIWPAESIMQSFPRPGFCYVNATRGCPFNCSFCSNGINLELYKKDYLRTRKVDAVITELKYLKSRYPIELFYFPDEMIMFDTNYVTELFTRIHDEVGVSYGCLARVEYINEDIVKLLSKTNCRYLGMGVECGDEEFRKTFLNRHMTNAQIISAFKMLKAVPDLMLMSFNMKGYPVPYDDELTKKTYALNDIIQPSILQMAVFYPFPGTTLYDYCVERDLIDPEKVKYVRDFYTTSVLRDWK